MTALVQAGLGGRAYYLLTTTGRRSGLLRTTPVMLVENPGERWLVSPYGNVSWVYNLRAKPDVTLSRGGRPELLHAEEVPPEVAAPVLKQYLGQAAVTAPFFDTRARDPVDDFVKEADRHPVFRLVSSGPAA